MTLEHFSNKIYKKKFQGNFKFGYNTYLMNCATRISSDKFLKIFNERFYDSFFV